jgi:hypothetical protein
MPSIGRESVIPQNWVAPAALLGRLLMQTTMSEARPLVIFIEARFIFQQSQVALTPV